MGCGASKDHSISQRRKSLVKRLAEVYDTDGAKVWCNKGVMVLMLYDNQYGLGDRALWEGSIDQQMYDIMSEIGALDLCLEFVQALRASKESGEWDKLRLAILISRYQPWWSEKGMQLDLCSAYWNSHDRSLDPLPASSIWVEFRFVEPFSAAHQIPWKTEW